ncbi:MAG TPA: hypothetical protein VMZ91_03070 [Candidatus Paceibacterota bacterium]|nr:hypothetical protein [Candidatus Paceibacterota bacterium]
MEIESGRKTNTELELKFKKMILEILEKNTNGEPATKIAKLMGRDYYLVLKCINELLEDGFLTKFVFRKITYYQSNYML